MITIVVALMPPCRHDVALAAMLDAAPRYVEHVKVTCAMALRDA